MVAGVEYLENAKRGYSLELVRQFEKNDPGTTEKSIPSVFLINLKAQIALNDVFRLKVAANNLSNRRYFSSADERTPLAVGRHLNLELSVQF